MEELTEKEQKYVDKIVANLEFYDRYKKFMGQVKGVYLEKGPEAAIEFIRGKDEFILKLAVDELFSALFTNL